MFDRLFLRMRAFGGDRRGVALVLFVILTVPMMLLIGVAIDVGHVLAAKVRLQAALDAAALYIASNPSMTGTQAQNYANAYVSANLLAQSDATLSSPVTVTRVNNTVTVTGTANVNTTFLQFSGYNTLSAGVSSTATSAQNNLEVALVLDNTGSMNQMYGNQTGIAGLQAAATALVNTLFASDPTGQYVKISVVPFTDTVNVGTQYANASWIDNSNAAGSLSQENIAVPTGTGLIAFASSLAKATGRPWSWGGCVRQRTEPYDLEDVAPTSGNPATLYTPFFAPDEPDPANYNSDNCKGQSQSFYNSYLCDNSCWAGTTAAEEAQDQQCVAKYTSSPQASNSAMSGSTGPNTTCTTLQPLIRLTNSQTAILNEINLMTAAGATVIPAGLMWGWHTISPNGPFADGVPYSNTTAAKVIILLTDGCSDVQLSSGGTIPCPPSASTNGFNAAVYNAYGYLSPHLNKVSVPSGVSEDKADYNLDQKITTICNNIKAVQDANGNPGRIILYTIGFGTVLTQTGLAILQNCATDSAHYFYNPTSEELITTFQQIAIGLNALRLSH
jgi:Flp pilus assembly protein TadG